MVTNYCKGDGCSPPQGEVSQLPTYGKAVYLVDSRTGLPVVNDDVICSRCGRPKQLRRPLTDDEIEAARSKGEVV